MRRANGSNAANILLLFVICCLWCHIQPAAGGKCSGAWAIHACAGGNGKRSGIDDDGLGQATDLRADGGGRSDIQDAREGGERRGGGGGREGERREGGGGGRGDGGGKDIGGYRGSREGDNDRRRQPSDERQLVDIGNDRRGHSPRSAELDSAINRLRSLLGTTDLQDVDDRGEEEGKREQRQEEEEEEGEPQRFPTDSDTDRRYVVKESLTMLRRILDDIERRLDAPPISHSVSKNKGYADDTEDRYYSLQKRAVDQ